jgi:TRAP-type transport system periplasmic protein
MKNLILKPTVLVLMVAVVVISLLAGACTKPAATTAPTPTSAPTQTQLINLKMATGQPAGTPSELLNDKWIEKIQKETNGRVKITHYPAGTLVDAFASYDQLLAGVADIANISPTLPGSPLIISGAIPALFYGTDLVTARKVWDELWKEFPEMSAEYATVKMLFAQGGTSSYAHTKSPIRKLDDFKGLTLQPPPDFPTLLGKMGATGSNMPPMEIYSALEKGIISGVCMASETLQSMNYADITQYSTNLHLIGPPGISFCMNLDTWNRLPPDIQKVFEDSLPWMNTEIDKLLLEIDQEAIDYAKAKGHEFIELPSEDLNKLYSYMDEIALGKAAELDTKGLPGTKIYQETRRLIDEYSKK